MCKWEENSVQHSTLRKKVWSSLFIFFKKFLLFLYPPFLIKKGSWVGEKVQIKTKSNDWDFNFSDCRVWSWELLINNVILEACCLKSMVTQFSVGKSQGLSPGSLTRAVPPTSRSHFASRGNEEQPASVLWGGYIIVFLLTTCLVPHSTEIVDFHLGTWVNNNSIWRQKLGGVLGEGTSVLLS